MPELILSEFKCTCMYGFINKHLEPDYALPRRLRGRIWSGLAFFSLKKKWYESGLVSGDFVNFLHLSVACRLRRCWLGWSKGDVSEELELLSLLVVVAHFLH